MTAPRVFISYSQDSAEHKDLVLALANRLRNDQVDCWIDQYVDAPPEGWPTWMAQQIRDADFVLVVCTAEHQRRFDPEHTVGAGSRFESVLIVQDLYNARMWNRRFLPVLLGEAAPEHILEPLQPYSHYRADTESGYEALLRHVHESPLVQVPPLGQRPALDPKPIRALQPRTSDAFRRSPALESPALESPAPKPDPRPFAVDPRVGRTFVGRETELAALHEHLIEADSRSPVAICAIDGMGGVGKSYLADRFAWEHRDAFPGGYVRLVLDPLTPQKPDAAFAELAEQLDLPEGPKIRVRVRQALLAPRVLLHVENVDSDAAYRSTAEILGDLVGCTAVVTGRVARLGASQGWPRVDLGPFSKQRGLDQLWDELELKPATATAQGEHARLVEALGRLPLAIHLAAGHLAAGRTVDSFLHRLRSSGLALEPVDGAETVGKDQGRRILSEVFELSIELLGQALGDQAEVLLPGFRALGHAPASGFGRSLGAALAGLEEIDFEDLVLAAVKLSLLLEIPTEERPQGAWRVHPLVAELARGRSVEASVVVDRATEWFVERLPRRPAGEEHLQGIAWRAIHEESRALAWWLDRVPESDWQRVERAGSWMAITSGPYRPWIVFCQIGLEACSEDLSVSQFLWTLSRSALRAGEVETAWKAAQDKVRVEEERRDEKEVASARGVIADILETRGDLDEAMRIRKQEELPVYEKLGDVHARAITLGRIADILYSRGDFDEAMRIRKQEELPVHEKLGDVRERAVTLGRIADILHARGDFDEAMRIREQEQLPVYEKLGDVRSRAVTLGQIADILHARGDFDEAMRIREQEELPVFEQLGDARERAVTLGKIADILEARSDFDEAMRIREQEELPVYEKLGDVRSRLIVWWKLGLQYRKRGREGDHETANRLLRKALRDAERLRIPEAERIRRLLKTPEEG